MRTKNAYRIAGKISLGLVLFGGVIALAVPAIRKRIWYAGNPTSLILSREHSVVPENPVAEEVSIVQNRCHPGI